VRELTNALSHATSWVIPSSLRAQYTPGLHARPLTIMSGACWGSPGGALTTTSTTNWTSFFSLSAARVCLLHLERHAFPDALLHPETHAFSDACVNLIGASSSCFASPPTVGTLMAFKGACVGAFVDSVRLLSNNDDVESVAGKDSGGGSFALLKH
jgi:hypothetical protein